MKRFLIALIVSISPAAFAADIILDLPPTGDGRLIPSSWVDPDGSDSDIYAYDSFIMPADATITEVHWRGGYVYNAMYGRAFDFRFTFYETNMTGYEPLCGNPEIDETVYLDDMWVGNNAHETYAGTFNGVPMYDYTYVLRRPFHATAGVKYWLRIEGSQPVIPDWAIARGTGGDGGYFRFVAGANMFQRMSGDISWTFYGTMACTPATVTQQPTAAGTCPAGSASFHVVAGGSGPFTYEWQRETSPGVFIALVDGPSGSWDGGAPGIGAIVTGSGTDTLWIEADTANGLHLGQAHAIRYRCVVTNGCGNAASAAAQLSVCAADLTCDGALSVFDFLAFQTAFGDEDPLADMAAPFGVLNVFDFLAFQTAFGNGC